MKQWPGTPFPLGATFDGEGVNFSLFSEVAEKVELCLFDQERNETRIELCEVHGHCHHVYLPGVKIGQFFGWRVHGPWDPANGKLCNPAKLLSDPYAKGFLGEIEWDDAIFPYVVGDEEMKRDERDSAPFVPLCVVVDQSFDWEGVEAPNTPWGGTLIYETYVKYLTMLHPEVPPEQRGTYAEVAHPAVISHLKKLCVSAVELMPIHQFVQDRHLVEKGLRNHWGYNTIGFFSPHDEYSQTTYASDRVKEFKTMVKALHAEGIEVILDVVYNHTAEGNHLGPMLSLKGIDNEHYYRLSEDPRYYDDVTGTGNTLDMRYPHTVQMVMDSLRYWITEMHIDGFRFDLASALARNHGEVDRLSAFFEIIQQDPVIQKVKLIAEPWDLGEGGYQVGNFPPLWSEWNGKYRDSVRQFWRGDHTVLADMASRLSGSADLYENATRRPYASFNVLTAHDGFTLRDLVSYEEKHNEANGEDNKDGTDDNNSCNMGVEGPSDDLSIMIERAVQQRNFFTTLMLSQGVPMLLGGDEMGRTQKGSNNAYCQDNDISWYDWKAQDKGLLDFVEKLNALWRQHPVFSRSPWFDGSIPFKDIKDIAWFGPNGKELEQHDWDSEEIRCFAMFLGGDNIPSPIPKGDPVTDQHFLLIFNAAQEPVTITLPGKPWANSWAQVMNTRVGWIAGSAVISHHSAFEVAPRYVIVMCRA